MQVPTSPNRFRNMQMHTEGDPCIICGKGIEFPSKYIIMEQSTNELVRVSDYESMTDDEIDALGSDGPAAFPVGPDCLRKHPEVKPYVL